MTVLFINRFGTKIAPYTAWLHDCPVEKVMIAFSDVAEGWDGFKEVVTVPYDRTYLGEVDEIFNLALDLARRHDLKAVVALSEGDVRVAAQIREALGIAGQLSKSSEMFRDKLIMKEHLQSRGVAVPRFAHLTSGEECAAFMAAMGGPIIVKPRLGTGSQGVSILRSAEECRRLKPADLEGMMVEEFIDADMYSIDGLIIDAAVRFICASKYHHSNIEAEKYGFAALYTLPSGTPVTQKLCDYVAMVLSRLDCPLNTSFHGEVFWREGFDSPLLCEIASRSPGAGQAQSILETHAVDLNRASVRAQLGLDPEVRAEYAGQIYGTALLLPVPGRRFIGVPEMPAEAFELKVFRKVGEMMPLNLQLTDYFAAARVSSGDEADLMRKVYRLAGDFKQSCFIDP